MFYVFAHFKCLKNLCLKPSYALHMCLYIFFKLSMFKSVFVIRITYVKYVCTFSSLILRLLYAIQHSTPEAIYALFDIIVELHAGGPVYVMKSCGSVLHM
jgi:hypothetical protein